MTSLWCLVAVELSVVCNAAEILSAGERFKLPVELETEISNPKRVVLRIQSLAASGPAG